MNAVTVANLALHGLLLSALGLALVRWLVKDARHRAWASLIALSGVVIIPLVTGLDFSHRIPVSLNEGAVAVPTAPWKPDWKVSMATFLAPRSLAPAIIEEPLAPRLSLADLARWAGGIWMGGGIVMALRHGALSLRAWRWRRALRPLDNGELRMLPSAVSLFSLHVSGDDGSPCVVGLWRPVIAVPARVIGEWSPRQWQWLLRHEGEHLRGCDVLTAWLLGWVKAAFWWNPFVHALTEEWAQAREQICDSAVVMSDADPSAYSAFLLDLAASTQTCAPAFLHMAASRPARRLRARMVAMLAGHRVRERVAPTFLLGACAMAAPVAALVSCVGLKNDSTGDANAPASGLTSSRTRRTEIAEGTPGSIIQTSTRWLEMDAETARSGTKIAGSDVGPLFPNGVDQRELTDPQYQLILRSLSTQKNVDLMSAPLIVTKSGEGAVAEMRLDSQAKPSAKVTIQEPSASRPDFTGVRTELLATSEGRRVRLEVHAELGERDMNEEPKVRHLRKSKTATIGNGHTLMLRVGPSPTRSERIVVLFVTTRAIDLKGKSAYAKKARTQDTAPRPTDLPVVTAAKPRANSGEENAPWVYVDIWTADVRHGKEADWLQHLMGRIFQPDATDIGKNKSTYLEPQARPGIYRVSGALTPEQGKTVKQAFMKMDQTRMAIYATKISTREEPTVIVKEDDGTITATPEYSGDGRIVDLSVVIDKSDPAAVMMYDGGTVVLSGPLSEDVKGGLSRLIFVTPKRAE